MSVACASKLDIRWQFTGIMECTGTKLLQFEVVTYFII